VIKVAPAGFRYGFVENIFREDIYEELAKAFPDVSLFTFIDKPSGGGHKRFYVGPNYYSGKDWGCICSMKQLPGIWQEVLRESVSPELINLLQVTTGIKFNSLCNFGFAFGNEGCFQQSHIDGAARPGDSAAIHSTIACLLYLNNRAGGSTGTRIYAPDRKTILFQAPNLRNSMSFFEQHPDSWHGFPLVPKSEERRIVSLSYSQESQPLILKTSLTHRLICKKNIKRLVYGKRT